MSIASTQELRITMTMDNTHQKERTRRFPFAALSIFVGGFTYSVLPKANFDSMGTLWHALLVGSVTAIAALAIVTIEKRISGNQPPM